MDMLCSDKTGTLTLNKMVIQVCKKLNLIKFQPKLIMIDLAGRLSNFLRRGKQGDYHVSGSTLFHFRY